MITLSMKILYYWFTHCSPNCNTTGNNSNYNNIIIVIIMYYKNNTTIIYFSLNAIHCKLRHHKSDSLIYNVVRKM